MYCQLEHINAFLDRHAFLAVVKSNRNPEVVPVAMRHTRKSVLSAGLHQLCLEALCKRYPRGHKHIDLVMISG